MEKFHVRFGIKVDIEEARKNFVNRADNLVFHSLFLKLPVHLWEDFRNEIATDLGERYGYETPIDQYVRGDFHRTLQALEAFYRGFPRNKKDVEAVISRLLNDAEVDLGIRWEDGRFLPSGAKLLDERLVNEELRWLRTPGLESVLQPFEKGLGHFVHAQKRPELLADVVTDMYEALEALAGIITGRPDKDLSANRELFISTVNASEAYKKILREYIDYANQFRHAAKEGKPKPPLSEREVESFMYLTGLFIRLAIGVGGM